MTNIKFMDEIAAPRRSIHPGQQLSRRSRPVNEIGLSEYAIAMAIDLPQLDLYTKVSSDLNAWMEKSKVSFAEAEDEASKVTPELFVEYARADEDGQAELLVNLFPLFLASRSTHQILSINLTSSKQTPEDQRSLTGTTGS